jgi:hypothetical protein
MYGKPASFVDLRRVGLLAGKTHTSASNLFVVDVCVCEGKPFRMKNPHVAWKIKLSLFVELYFVEVLRCMFWPELFVPRADLSLAAFVDQRVVVLFA